MVAEYLLEMRDRNPHRPKTGDRITWDTLKTRLKLSLAGKATETEAADMLKFIESQIVYHCSESLKKLNQP